MTHQAPSSGEEKGGTVYRFQSERLHPVFQRALPARAGVNTPLIVYDKVTSEKLRRAEDSAKEIERRISELALRVKELEAYVSAATVVVEVRELPDAEAKRLIKEYFEQHHGETAYASDIALSLKLDYEQVTRLMTELENEGQIAKAQI